MITTISTSIVPYNQQPGDFVSSVLVWCPGVSVDLQVCGDFHSLSPHDSRESIHYGCTLTLL